MSKPPRIRVVVADDHPAMLLGIECTLMKTGSFELLARVENSTELVVELDRFPCDVLVSDYVMPDGKYGDGIERPALRFVICTMLENSKLIGALVQSGFNCVLSKSDPLEHISQAVNAAYQRQVYISPSIKDILLGPILTAGGMGKVLSPREAEIVRLLGSGLTITEIARKWNRSVQTISTQKLSAMRKLGFKRDVELFKYAGSWHDQSG
ncbi:response regulator [Cupriavidus basilensis OR16]|uniref:Response regulator n=2 Tax=Cupriavidus basilensis TaxID=68895 RepID=H1S7J0_9BURK|nr:response regulator [Cupriavidus basilensis OR16]